MTGTTIELRHGGLECSLLVCNKSLRLAQISFTQDTGLEASAIFSGDSVAFSEFLTMYLYHSYAIYCKINREARAYDEMSFEDALYNKEVELKDSNVSEVIKQMTDTLLTEMKERLEQVQPSKKKETKPKSGMN